MLGFNMVYLLSILIIDFQLLCVSLQDDGLSLRLSNKNFDLITLVVAS